MAETNSSLYSTHKSFLLSQFSAGDRRLSTGTSKQSNEPEKSLNPSSTMAKTAPFFTSLDPRSMILSQFGNDQQPNFLQLTTENFEMERGPRYRAYAQLRESRLRMKMSRQYPEEPDPNLSPPKKQIKFQGNFPATTTSTPVRRKGSSVHSVVAQSVPDFSSMLRKENRRPANGLPPLTEKSLTPPASSRNSKLYGVGTKSGGSKSVNAGEKRIGGGGARKSYANMEELKGLSAAAASAINGGGGRGGRTRTILGYRQ